MVKHSTRKRAARRLQAANNLPYSVARRTTEPSLVIGQRDALHHPYIGSVANHWANSGIPVIGWRAGGSGVDRWGGIWFDEDFRDDHGCEFHQLHWSPRVFSPSDRSGWEMHLIPAGRAQKEPKYHIPNRFDLARQVFVPSPQQLLSDLMVFINGTGASPRTCRTLPETASHRLDEHGLIPQLEKYVSKVEQRTGVAQCCLAGMCDAEGPVLYSAID